MNSREATVLAATAAFALLAGPVAATPPTPGGIVGTVVARADFTDPVDIKLKVTDDNQEVIHAPNARQTVMQSIVFSPGAHTGWHSHPGPVVVLVKSGELTLHADHEGTCEVRTYTTGQAFIDRGQGHAHVGRNTAAGANTELWVTYFDVPPGAPFRIDAPDPGNCAF